MSGNVWLANVGKRIVINLVPVYITRVRIPRPVIEAGRSISIIYREDQIPFLSAVRILLSSHACKLISVRNPAGRSTRNARRYSLQLSGRDAAVQKPPVMIHEYLHELFLHNHPVDREIVDHSLDNIQPVKRGDIP